MGNSVGRGRSKLSLRRFSLCSGSFISECPLLRATAKPFAKNEKYIYNLFTMIIKLLPNFNILTNGKKPYLIILSSKFSDRVIRGNSESLINLQTSS